MLPRRHYALPTLHRRCRLVQCLPSTSGASYLVAPCSFRHDLGFVQFLRLAHASVVSGSNTTCPVHCIFRNVAFDAVRVCDFVSVTKEAPRSTPEAICIMFEITTFSSCGGMLAEIKGRAKSQAKQTTSRPRGLGPGSARPSEGFEILPSLLPPRMSTTSFALPFS